MIYGQASRLRESWPLLVSRCLCACECGRKFLKSALGQRAFRCSFKVALGIQRICGADDRYVDPGMGKSETERNLRPVGFARETQVLRGDLHRRKALPVGFRVILVNPLKLLSWTPGCIGYRPLCDDADVLLPGNWQHSSKVGLRHEGRHPWPGMSNHPLRKDPHDTSS
jgi:hypothetical protein